MANQRTAIVVGVGSPQGLGAALARRFAREGLKVVIVGRSADRLKAIAADIGGRRRNVHPFFGDARKRLMSRPLQGNQATCSGTRRLRPRQ